MRALFLSALLGASVSFSSFAVQANEVTTPTAHAGKAMALSRRFPPSLSLSNMTPFLN